MAVPADPEVDPQPPSKDGPAADVLLVALRGYVAELQSREPGVRRDQPDSVHKMRVATRRLRSGLATFKPLVDPAVADHLRTELKWLAEALGEARDAEVMRDRLAALAGDQHHEIGSARVATELEERLAARYAEGHAHVLEVLGSGRYLALLDSLDLLVSSPPWTDKAAAPARKVLPKRIRRERKRLTRRAKLATKAPTEADSDIALHEVRKVAKRLRYACEALAPTFGQRATDLARAAEHLQEVLGDHQDSVESRRVLRDLAARTSLAGDDALIYGRLHLLEQARSERARSQYKSALAQVRTKRKAWGKA